MHTAFAQWPRFSIATDVSAQRSFKKEQQFWAASHTTIANFHITEKDGVYIWFGYNSSGNFSNKLMASARSITTTPLQIEYENKVRMRFKHFSVGWKHYLKGSPDAEVKWNLYGLAGFGLMLGTITNSKTVSIDTISYALPVSDGVGSFRRLTADFGLGAEYPLGSDIYLYSEGRFWLPTTDYPSKYILVNKKAPVVALLGIGLRLLF